MSRADWLGFLITILWFIFGLFYVREVEGISSFIQLAPNEHGDFFAGLFAPIAFLWIVIGYFKQTHQLHLQQEELRMQRTEIALQREEMARVADENQRQSNSLEASSEQSRRDIFFKTKDMVEDELHEIEKDLILRGEYRPEENMTFIDETRKSSPNRALNLLIQGRHTKTLNLWGQYMDYPNIQERYIEYFEFLLEEARIADKSGSLLSLVRDSARGKFYKSLKSVFQPDSASF